MNSRFTYYKDLSGLNDYLGACMICLEECTAISAICDRDECNRGLCRLCYRTLAVRNRNPSCPICRDGFMMHRDDKSLNALRDGVEDINTIHPWMNEERKTSDYTFKKQR